MTRRERFIASIRREINHPDWPSLNDFLGACLIIAILTGIQALVSN